VETLSRPPQTPVRPRSIAEAPRHWPKRVLVGATVLLLTTIVAGATWLANVEPIDRGSVAYAITGRSLHVTRRSVDAMGVLGSVQTIPLRRGLTFTYRFSVRNAGPVPITIVDVGVHDARETLPMRAVAAKPDLFEQPGPAVGFGPFEPFQLPSDQEAGLEVQVHVARDACYVRGSESVIWRVPLTYRVLGVTRHSWIDTRTEIHLVGTRDTTC
jgi:hypothetical protein